MKRLVIKISGSIFYWNKVNRLPNVISVIKKYAKKPDYAFVLVAGGGEIARKYIGIGRSFGGNEGLLDEIGLKGAQLNAALILCLLDDLAYQSIPNSLDECIRATYSNKIVVVGGLHPGHSTNAVAALIAERIGAYLFINATDVDGVYTKDPKKFPNAKRIEKIRVAELKRLIQEKEYKAGSYELIDLVAVNIIQRAKLKTRIIRCEPDALEKAILDQDVGTEIEA
ncbi:MAG: UMP kinase [Conexivisphaerales archaeon]